MAAKKEKVKVSAAALAVAPKVQAEGSSGSKTWSGDLVTGPIRIPVAMYAAARSERIGFNMLHAQCHGQVKQAGYYCPCCVEVRVLADFKYQPARSLSAAAEAFAAREAKIVEMAKTKQVVELPAPLPPVPFIECKTDDVLVMHADDATVWALAKKIQRTDSAAMVDSDQIVKGYEYAKGTFAVVTKEELEALKPASAKTVDIRYFVTAGEVDPLYFEASYYFPPTEMSRAYAMLRQGMIAKGVMAVGRICVRNSESTVFIKPHVNGGLVAYTAYATDEVRAVNVPAEPVLSPAELKAVSDYIEANTSPLDLSEFKDEYRARVTELVEAKKNGGTIQAVELPKPKPTETVDLVAMFSMSAKIAIEQRAARKTA